MRAALRETYTLDDGAEIGAYSADDPSSGGAWVRLVVGPADGPGEESFDVFVCTPAWLQESVSDSGPQIGRHLLVVETLDLTAAVAFLRQHVESLEAADWRGLAEQLARIGHWEFEDHTP
ncbi:immunity 8 family protein [Cellulomonas palmilytica]|uniref:immunity 8 family protein n=1 Tax=Cellulomonas palmilytica TaxID=2608402 RepID=UPI001F3E4E2E|nr:immunity 8 family protein [Cellulomonas palmilytica]UJP40598.1 immunity 8 family protein [Cellulomonas palmilytica]